MNKLVMALIRSPLRRLTGRHLVVLCYTGPKSERVIELPVQALPCEDGWMVAVGGHEKKNWYKAFRRPLAATLQTGSNRRTVTGHLLDGVAREAAWADYRERVPAALKGAPGTPVVQLRPMELAR